jgi:ribonuclease P protein component
VLPYDNRLRRPAEFRSVIAAGKRARGGALIVHFVADRSADAQAEAASTQWRPIVGFVVGKAVGNSVVRHRVTRRLRAQLQSRLPSLPARSAIVIRALAGADAMDSATISRELDLVLGRVLKTSSAGSASLASSASSVMSRGQR